MSSYLGLNSRPELEERAQLLWNQQQIQRRPEEVSTPWEAELQTQDCTIASKEVNELEVLRKLFERYFPTLSFEYIQTMNDVGMLGRNKYGDNAIECRIKRGDVSRTDRVKSREIARHAGVHWNDYLDGVKHDIYRTRKHQLGAAGFNPMMEFMLAELDKEITPTQSGMIGGACDISGGDSFDLGR